MGAPRTADVYMDAMKIIADVIGIKDMRVQGDAITKAIILLKDHGIELETELQQAQAENERLKALLSDCVSEIATGIGEALNS